MYRTLLFSFSLVLMLVSCDNKQKADDPLAPTGRTQRTENLLSSLKRIADKGYMFGHQDSPMYGIGWSGDSARSDVKDVCNDFPAVMGFDLGRIELGDSVNLYGVRFDLMRQQIINQYDRGGMVTLSWHVEKQPTDKSLAEWAVRVADFLNSIVTPYGVKVPVALRLHHDFTARQWHIVVDALKERGVTNALYAYTAVASAEMEEEGGAERYLKNYPGDDIIDLLGLDIYCEADDVEGYRLRLDACLSLVCGIAADNGKVAALTETGFMDIPMETWWTEVLAPALDNHPLSYVLVWRNNNDEPKHCFAPYPGQVSANDFVRFYNLPKTLFLHDVQGLYLKRSEEANWHD